MAFYLEPNPLTGRQALRGDFGGPFTDAGDGTWLDLRGVYPLNVCLEGDWTGEVEICVSNLTAKPADTFHGAPMSDVKVQRDRVVISEPARWGKVRRITMSGGSLYPTVYSG